MTLSPLGTVDWVRTAFRSNPRATDDELVQILVDAGPPQASRAVVMLVIAFGRRVLLDMVDLSSTYYVGEVEQVLTDDPIYAVAHFFAHNEPTRDDVERIGMHSSEVGVVNQALAAGHKAETLVLSPPELFFGPDPAPALADPQEVLDGVVRSHGSGVPFTCRVHPLEVSRGRVQAQLDFSVRVDDREIVESFSGVGSTIREAFADGFDKFTQGSLHVMIATVDRDHLDADHVTWETPAPRQAGA